VSGRVLHVGRSNLAVGPVYTVEWQDGLRETNLNTNAMLELLVPTPRGLGHGTPATPEVKGASHVKKVLPRPLRKKGKNICTRV
jgi:hypothetical protein